MKNEALIFYRIVRDFLTIYLSNQRGASNNTIKSYKDTLNIFIDYIRMSQGITLEKIRFGCISRDLVDGFLMWLETDRKYSVSSRNQRMSAIKSFLKYAAERDKAIMPLYLQVEVIPKKKNCKVKKVEFFSESALGIILAQPDQKKEKWTP